VFSLQGHAGTRLRYLGDQLLGAVLYVEACGLVYRVPRGALHKLACRAEHLLEPGRRNFGVDEGTDRRIGPRIVYRLPE
jgi:hypothetical protein